MEENPEEKKKSKLSVMIGQSQENINNSQFTVHYSENNWKTDEEINLILDDNATIKQLMDEAIQKFKTELFFDNIDKKQLIVRIFKKKKKIPNDEYPICNLNSKVNDFGKRHFCLVENVKENENKNEIEENIVEKEIQINKNVPDENNKINENKENLTKNQNAQKNFSSGETPDKNNLNKKNDENNITGNGGTLNSKSNKQNCRACMIF